MGAWRGGGVKNGLERISFRLSNLKRASLAVNSACVVFNFMPTSWDLFQRSYTSWSAVAKESSSPAQSNTHLEIRGRSWVRRWAGAVYIQQWMVIPASVFKTHTQNKAGHGSSIEGENGVFPTNGANCRDWPVRAVGQSCISLSVWIERGALKQVSDVLTRLPAGPRACSRLGSSQTWPQDKPASFTSTFYGWLT